MNRAAKVALLSRVLQGETTELKARKDKRGRPWTAGEVAQQRAYLSTLCPDQGATFIEQARQSLFGYYDISQVAFEGPLYGRELPNGWKVYKRPDGQ